MENSMEAPQKAQQYNYIWYNSTIPGVISKGNEINLLERHLTFQIPCGTIHSGKKELRNRTA
jgi:hypothetical protein